MSKSTESHGEGNFDAGARTPAWVQRWASVFGENPITPVAAPGDAYRHIPDRAPGVIAPATAQQVGAAILGNQAPAVR